MKTGLFYCYLLLFSILLQKQTPGWIFPEHREITLEAIKKLNSDQKKLLEILWAEARKGNENRLFQSVSDEGNTNCGVYIDFAAWPAIAGDHSVSASDMLNIILYSSWILEVSLIAHDLKNDLASSVTREQRINFLRNSDLLLQRADPAYATRAGHNDVHFLLSLSEMSESLSHYFNRCITPGEELNAAGVYSLYHNLALIKADYYFRSKSLNEEQKQLIILSALADEAFALHFLQDMTAAGHAAGIWGDASQKKGSHDYYNEFGFKTTTWKGDNILLLGDAWMREEDLKHSSELVKESLVQLLNAFSLGINVQNKSVDAKNVFSPGDFNISVNDVMPSKFSDQLGERKILSVLHETPVPALDKGLGSLPRFRSELGFFIGLAASLNATIITRGFGARQDYPGLVSGLDLIFKAGIGLDGVLSESGDGLVFMGAGVKRETGSTSGLVNDPGIETYGSLFSAIPARAAIVVKIRSPFFIIPGDLIIAAPVLLFLAPETLSKMAAFAVNGGLIPWQAGISTSVGKFQFILGREITLQFYGLNGNDVFWQETTDFMNNEKLALLSYRSARIELPVLEYRPFRSFAFDQSSKLFFQLYGGVDIPYGEDLILPDTVNTPVLDNIWYMGIRLAFDWRYYF